MTSNQATSQETSEIKSFQSKRPAFIPLRRFSYDISLYNDKLPNYTYLALEKIPIPVQASKLQVFELLKVSFTYNERTVYNTAGQGITAGILLYSALSIKPPIAIGGTGTDYYFDTNSDVIASNALATAQLPNTFVDLSTRTYDVSDGRGNGIFITTPNLFLHMRSTYGGGTGAFDTHNHLTISLTGRIREVSPQEYATLAENQRYKLSDRGEN